MSEVPEVVAINRDLGLILMDDGSTLPITGFLDCEGEDCGVDEAVACVAGQDGVGWWAVSLPDFISVSIH